MIEHAILQFSQLHTVLRLLFITSNWFFEGSPWVTCGGYIPTKTHKQPIPNPAEICTHGVGMGFCWVGCGYGSQYSWVTQAIHYLFPGFQNFCNITLPVKCNKILISIMIQIPWQYSVPHHRCGAGVVLGVVPMMSSCIYYHFGSFYRSFWSNFAVCGSSTRKLKPGLITGVFFHSNSPCAAVEPASWNQVLPCNTGVVTIHMPQLNPHVGTGGVVLQRC